MENQIKKNPYTFKKDAWHTKLYFWIWGINVSKTFKTMCPYFWSWVGTIAIIPVIILVKLLRVPSGKFAEFIVKQLEKCREFTNTIRDAKEKRKEKARNVLKAKMVEEFKIYFKNQSMNSAHELSLKITSARTTFSYIMQAYVSSLPEKEAIDFSSETVYNKYFKFLDEKRNRKLKSNESTFPETSIYEEVTTTGTGLNYIFMAIMGIFGVAGILCIGYAFYYVLFNMVIPNIKSILIISLIMLACTGIIVGVITFLRCWGDIIFDNIRNFLIKLGNFIKPIGKVFMIFIWIGTFFKLTWGVIHAIYKKNCPIINWED